ncbi:uncharacterized protein PRCAT00004050001 [Priceomyces carsonii]|uniref:uncharacterized protein n=1 Tax=Priceomyces carsonii TaxID=28549 RepID=UPI002ED7F001|nr:unnamed protein product [Priceomyces carsonii]
MTNKLNKFQNTPFTKEGKATVGWQSKAQPERKARNSEFIQELAETGRADWKKAPKEIKTRYRGIFLVLLSIPLILMPSYELYRRLEGKSTKKVQEGEILEGKEVRKFGETEKWETERKSLMYKLFGRDFFLDGFTSKTMAPSESKEVKKEGDK